MTSSPSAPKELAERFAEVRQQLLTRTSADEALATLTRLGVQLVGGAEHAAVTRGRDGRFETVAATSHIPLEVDAIQYELSTGPCVDALLQQTVFCSSDLRVDSRWPQFGQRAAEATGVLSMLSFRLFLEKDDLIAGLNFYAGQPDAFDESAEVTGTLLATYGALAVSGALEHERAENLQIALQTNRNIGIAMGILMAHNFLSRDQAFDLLRVASQHTHRKLALIALDVIETGQLEIPGARSRRRSRRSE